MDATATDRYGTVMIGRLREPVAAKDQQMADLVRRWIDERKVPADLPFVDYEAPRRSVFPFLGSSVQELARSILGLPLDLQPTIEKLAGQKLFLDGLVSVWQVDHD